MAKFKIEQPGHAMPIYPPAPMAYLPTPPSRVAASFFVVCGELLAVAFLALGVVTAAGWIDAGFDHRATVVQQPTLICAVDRRGVEWCRPADRLPPVRRHYARDLH